MAEKRLQDAEHKRAYERGKAAFLAGKPKTANPYHHSSPLWIGFWSSWSLGWTNAQIAAVRNHKGLSSFAQRIHDEIARFYPKTESQVLHDIDTLNEALAQEKPVTITLWEGKEDVGERQTGIFVYTERQPFAPTFLPNGSIVLILVPISKEEWWMFYRDEWKKIQKPKFSVQPELEEGRIFFFSYSSKPNENYFFRI